MAKKKKKAARATEQKINKDAPFNNPFLSLKKSLSKAAQPAPEPPKTQPKTEFGDEENAFARAMADVTPLGERDRGIAPKTGKPNQPLLPPDDDLEVMAQLADLISGEGEFDLRLTGQHVEGAAAGVSAELLERLGQGDFPIQDYLDLHGLGQDEALAELERFLVGCATKGLRHVLVVHGRGLGSPEGEPVLKKALAKSLTHKRLQKRVLAFATALPRDGGAGAMYVLLRKWSGPGAPAW